MSIVEKDLVKVQHPLDPLSADEIREAISILRENWNVAANSRFVYVQLQEPTKEVVLNYKPGKPVDREAFIVLLNNDDRKVYEAVVSINERLVNSWKHIPGVQAAITLDEFTECEELVKANPEFQQALLKRGITNFDLVMVDPWSIGDFGREDEKHIRLSRTLSWVRSDAKDNGYAHPIEGVIAIVDLNKMQVIRVEDYGVVPLPSQNANYGRNDVELRTDLKPLDIIQPEGPSFTVNGHEIEWQKWKFRVGFTPREGLVLHTVGYQAQGVLRPIIYRASLSEMVVPYGDPGPSHYTKNAFDSGEYGIGMLANSLELGCDCLGTIHYLDAVMSDSRGNVLSIPNAICIHEEDYGTLWKHSDWRTGDVEVRRSRRLVVSSISTVANYEYGFFWYFYQDGNMQFEIKLTGILSTGALIEGEKRKYGTLLAPGLYAPNHQHIFNVRMDMSIDGMNNSVYEVNSVPEPAGPQNPFGNAYYAESTLLKTESDAQRVLNLESARYWKIVNPNVTNALGEPVGYKIVTGENGFPFAHPESSVTKRAGFITKHLWVTPYDAEEKHAAGNYPNQHPGGDGLVTWTKENRSVENEDIVVWYTMNHNHIPRPEDWPVMPVATIGFSLKPVGFFDYSPALDVPPAQSKNSCCNK